MKLNFAKVGASAALAGALLLAAPLAAQADPQEYVPTSPGTQSREITEDGPQGFGGYAPGSPVDFTLIGVGVTGSNIATAGLPVTSASVTKFADATGAATAVITLPDPQVGTYLLTASGTLADGTPGTSTTVVGSGTSTGGTSAGGTTDASGSLPATGMDANSLLGFWVGGGALVLAGATVAVVATARRNRSKA